MTPRIDRTHGPELIDAGVGVRPDEPPEALPVAAAYEARSRCRPLSSESGLVDVAVAASIRSRP